MDCSHREDFWLPAESGPWIEPLGERSTHYRLMSGVDRGGKAVVLRR
jgi:hypothetical protein